MFCTTSSVVFMGKCSHLIALFKSLGSMQILSFLGVSTMTMLFTQSVGSSCFLITPSFSILWSSSLTWSWSATGTFLGACTTGGTLGSSLILYSPGRQPNPLNESAYSSLISTPTEQSLSMSPSRSPQHLGLLCFPFLSRKIGHCVLHSCKHMWGLLSLVSWCDVQNMMLVLLLTSSSSCHWLDWVFWILCAKWYCT